MHSPSHIPPDPAQLLEEATRYLHLGDVYHAVKLYKRIIKLAPDWPQPYQALSTIYTNRQEWKPAFHYCKKMLALQPFHQEGWFALGLIATALKKPQLAHSVWTKFGLDNIPQHPEGLRLSYEDTFEITWMLPLSAAVCRLQSIPHPASGYRYRDEILYKREIIGHHIVKRRKIPVFSAIAVFKRSPYCTFSCLLVNCPPTALRKLELMCQDARLGFEVWSNATQSMVLDNPETFPEYYSSKQLFQRTDELAASPNIVVAIAALHAAEVLHLLDAWRIITLGAYSDLRSY